MTKLHQDDLSEAKRIAARLLATPPEPHKPKKGADKAKPGRRLPVSPKGRNDRRDSEKD